MDLHTVCCTFLFLTCTGLCFAQQLLLPEKINKTAGEDVLITPIRIPDTPPLFIMWRLHTDLILSGPPNGITITPPYTDRVTLNISSLALELRRLTESDSGQYSLTVNTDSGPLRSETSLQVFGGSLSAGAIAGIVIGVLLGVAGTAGLIFYFMKGKKVPKINSRGNNQNGATYNADKHDSNYENFECFQIDNTGSDTQTPHRDPPDMGVIYENMIHEKESVHN